MSFIAVKQSSGCTSRKRRSPAASAVTWLIRSPSACAWAEMPPPSANGASNRSRSGIENTELPPTSARASASASPRPVPDRDVDRDALHVGELGEVRLDALEQPRLAKAAVDQDDRNPPTLGAVDAGYELCHAASLPTNGDRAVAIGQL